jgi:large repetitive protein
VGSIAPGLAADLILVQSGYPDPYEAVVRARPQDIILVLRGGRALVGHADVMPVAAAGARGCEPVAINGAADELCIAGETGKSYRALAAAMAAKGIWPAVFDGPPPIEPPCETRAPVQRP